MGVDKVLEAIVERVPPPTGDADGPPRALIFDSEFDQYRGVVAYIRMIDGGFAKDDQIRAMQNGTEAEIDDLGFFRPQMTAVPKMAAGEVGYVITGIKDVAKLRVGDTLTVASRPGRGAARGLPRGPARRLLRPLPARHRSLRRPPRRAREAGAQRRRALSWEPETSDALGFGFRCGFLGLLHMDIVRERLEREYGLELLATTPNVSYVVTKTDGEEIEVHSPTALPDPGVIDTITEPYIRASLISPKEFVGPVMELCQSRRGTHVDMHFLSSERVQIRYDLPLGEIVLDFYDALKSNTRGYASLDYEPLPNRPGDLVKLDVLLAGDTVDALSIICHRDAAFEQGKKLVSRLRKTIPRQQFDVPVQAAIGSRVLARETVKAVRKDVTAKLYGGDVTRKNKLLDKQKKGKKRMKQVGSVEVPQEAFLAVLTLGDDD